MAWWQESDFLGHLDEVLTHVNEATDAATASPATRTCELYFHALNKLWNAFAQHEGEPGRADTPSFISLLKSMPQMSRLILLKSAALANLVDLTPEVMDHFVLKSRGYRPGQAIEASLSRDATEKHRKVARMQSATHPGQARGDRRWCPEKTRGVSLRGPVEYRRHGEKMPYGPDLDKARRDEEVCTWNRSGNQRRF